jgi:hypothetical protein
MVILGTRILSEYQVFLSFLLLLFFFFFLLSVDEIEQGRFCSKHLFFFTLDGYSMALDRFSAVRRKSFIYFYFAHSYVYIYWS